MKNAKKLLITVVILTLTFAGGIFAYSTMAEISPTDYLIFGGIGLIAISTIFLLLKKYRDEKKGLVTEDELSQSIKEKAASRAFIYSMYWWTMLMMFTIDTHISHEAILGIGIMGMGLIFIGLWLYYNNQGIESENTH